MKTAPGWILPLMLATFANPASADPSPERQQALRNLLKHDCGACHGLTLNGGLGPALLPETLKDKSDAVLLQTILEGRPGTPMPPWKPFIDKDEVLWLINLLREK